MNVWIFEDNLMWSSRLLLSVKGLGHEGSLQTTIPEGQTADVAIVNLGSTTLPAQALIPLLKPIGVTTIAHAGHKEKDLLELGKDLGVDILATNSELSNKLDKILIRIQEIRNQSKTT